jgi:hypothetical protein
MGQMEKAAQTELCHYNGSAAKHLKQRRHLLEIKQTMPVLWKFVHSTNPIHITNATKHLGPSANTTQTDLIFRD